MAAMKTKDLMTWYTGDVLWACEVLYATSTDLGRLINRCDFTKTLDTGRVQGRFPHCEAHATLSSISKGTRFIQDMKSINIGLTHTVSFISIKHTAIANMVCN